MLRPDLPLQTRYLDYGKVFVANGALDFSTLACSDAEVARYGPQLFNRGLLFPETSPFAGQIGAVSAALLMFEGGYLFTLVQRRREGELSADPRTDRPFNQVRFVLLSREMIAEAFTYRAALYSSLALAARDPAARIWLTDYTVNCNPQPWTPRLDRLDPLAPNPAAVRFVVNAAAVAARAATSGEAQPISVPLPGADWLEKLRLVEAVQYWVLPRLGILSFALDYVSVQNVHLRLFPLSPDAPAPLPAERIFAPGATGARFEDDYFAAVSDLTHEALYDPALPGLLSLPIGTAAAIGLFRVEKQGEPLSADDALRLYPGLARLGERRLSLLRRLPREASLDLLRRPDLPPDLRLDLLQIAFDLAHGLLLAYAPAHLAVPAGARADPATRDRIAGLLRASLATSPEPSLDLAEPRDQAELFRDLLLARRPPAAAGQTATTRPERLVLAAGQPLLDALLLRRRTPALAQALQTAIPGDPALFDEALAVLDRATDLAGLVWLWHTVGQGNFKRYCVLLEQAVQPAWYAELKRNAGAWREFLAEGRAIAPAAPAAQAGAADAPAEIGRLLRALPADLAPFVWQAALATSQHDAAFAEWWLFSEALALPDQLPALWEALRQLPGGALLAAGPQLNSLLGRRAGHSLLAACTPPGYDEPNEALYATVLRAWLKAGFRSEVGDLVLATEDISLLIAHLPGSNDTLAAVAASAVQAPAIHGLPPAQALRWAQAASGERRAPYRAEGGDVLFQRLIDLPAPGEGLLWHLLVEDKSSAPGAMRWADYTAVLERARSEVDALRLPPESRLRAYVEVAGRVDGGSLAPVFLENGLDLRRVVALLATHAATPLSESEALANLLPLAVFHLEAADPDLKDRVDTLLGLGLQHRDAATHLQGLPDAVLLYLRQNVCNGEPALAAIAHWIDAELARRARAIRVERIKPPAPTRATLANAPVPATGSAGAPSPQAPAPGQAAPSNPLASQPAHAGLPAATPAPATPDAQLPDLAGLSEAAPVAVLGELALPGAAPRKRDSATWLWVAIIFIGLLALAVLVGTVVWIQSL
jgi:hypothetical protein